MKKIIVLFLLIVLFIFLYERYNPFGHKLFTNKNKEIIITEQPLNYPVPHQKIEPKTAEEYFARAGRKRKNHDYKSAVADYTKAISLNPRYIQAYEARALMKDKIRDFTGSKQDYDSAIMLRCDLNKEKNKKDYGNLMKLIKKGNMKFISKKYNEAVYEYTAAINLYPQYGGTYILRADAEYLIKNYKNALSDYDTAVRMGGADAADPELYYKRGNVRYYLEDYKYAVEDYKKALEMNLKHEKTYYRLAGSLIFERKFDEALKMLKKFIVNSKKPYVYADDFHNWNKILNKYKPDEITRELQNDIRNLKVLNSTDNFI